MSERQRLALVTGASGGVGGAVVRALARDDFCVVATGRSATALDALRQGASVPDRLGKVEVITADLCSLEGRQRVCRTVRQKESGLDVLVLSHGVFVSGTGASCGEAGLQAAFDTNLTSRVLLFLELQPDLVRRGGYVFVVNTTAATGPSPGTPVYSASMAGCASFFRSMGGNDGVHGRIRICTIFLGRTATRMQEVVSQIDARPYRPERLLQPDAVASFVMSRINGPTNEDLSEVVLRPATWK